MAGRLLEVIKAQPFANVGTHSCSLKPNQIKQASRNLYISTSYEHDKARIIQNEVL